MHNGRSHIELFPVGVANDQWHRLAMSVSGHAVALYLDCDKVFQRVMESTIDRQYSPNVSLWLGQRSLDESLFKVCLSVRNRKSSNRNLDCSFEIWLMWQIMFGVA